MMKLDRTEVLVFGTAVAIGAVAVPALIKAWCRKRPKPPAINDINWKYAGTLDTLTLYPLKSGKGIDLQSAFCSEYGLSELSNDNEHNFIKLRDRFFLLNREDNGEQVTGVTYPIILKISIKQESKDSVRFSFPGKWDLIVQIPLHGRKIAKLWEKEPVGYLDCGDEAAVWLTDIIKGPKIEGEEQVRIRLGYWPDNNPRRNIIGVRRTWLKHLPGLSNDDTGAYSDLTSYMLMTSSSMDELNRRLEGITISARQFRPNFYIKTDEKPFSELEWKWVKIGNMIFRFVKGCKRCAFTTYDPETGLKYPNNEPLRTLNRMEEAKVTKPMEECPMMGIHLGSYSSDIVTVGEPVYIIS